MSQFMPISNDKDQEIREKISKTIFKTPEDFVKFYNSGLISKNFEQVRSLVQDLKDTYKDIREKKSNLVFISEEEVIIDEMIQKLSVWDTLVKIKREITDFLADKSITSEDIIVIDDTALLGKIAVNNEGEEVIETLDGDKLFNRSKTDEILSIIGQYSSLNKSFDTKYNGYIFHVSDLTNIDNSFIVNLKNSVPDPTV